MTDDGIHILSTIPFDVFSIRQMLVCLHQIRLKPDFLHITENDNGVININASEKGYDNNSFIKLENSLLHDEEKIKSIINEGEKYENLDNTILEFSFISSLTHNSTILFTPS